MKPLLKEFACLISGKLIPFICLSVCPIFPAWNSKQHAHRSHVISHTGNDEIHQVVSLMVSFTKTVASHTFESCSEMLCRNRNAPVILDVFGMVQGRPAMAAAPGELLSGESSGRGPASLGSASEDADAATPLGVLLLCSPLTPLILFGGDHRGD